MDKFKAAALGSTAVREPETKPFVQVTGDIGDFSCGAVLTKPMDIAQYFRDQADEGDVTLVLDDDAINRVVFSIPNQPPEYDVDNVDGRALHEAWETEVIGALLSANKGNSPVMPRALQTLPDQRPVTPTSSDARYKAGSVAGLAGERWDADPGFRSHMTEAVQAPEKVKRAPFDMMLDALRIEGVTVTKYGMASDTFAAMELFKYPVPGSYPEEDYDKGYKKNGTVRKEDQNKFAEYKKEISGELVAYDWYEDAFGRMKYGKEIAAEIVELKRAAPAKNSGAAATGKYANKSNNWKENQKKLWSGRQTAGVRALKVFMSALHTWKAIIDEPTLNANVTVGFVMDAPGDDKAAISEGFTTIFIADKKAPAGAAISQAYSLTAFANLDLDEAVANGGTFVNLRDSVKRGPKDKGTSAIEWNMETFLNNVSMQREIFTTSFVNELKQKANEKEGKPPRRTESAKHLIDDVCTIVTQLQSFYSMFGGSTWTAIQEELKEAQDEANAEAAKAEGVDTQAA